MDELTVVLPTEPVDQTPIEVTPVEEELSWEVMLSEVRSTVSSELATLRDYLTSQTTETQRMLTNLVETQTRTISELTAQITSLQIAAVTSTLQPLEEPIPETLIPEPENVVVVSPESADQTSEPPKPKRRTL